MKYVLIITTSLFTVCECTWAKDLALCQVSKVDYLYLISAVVAIEQY